MTLTSCSFNKEKSVRNQTNYFFVKYDIECCTELLLDTVKVDYSVNAQDSIFILNYIYHDDLGTDSVTYKLQELDTDRNQPLFIENGEKYEDNDFIFVSMENFKIKGLDFKVYKYAKNPFAIDGCISHFWTPKIGIIIKRSSTWRNYSKLQTDNDSINEYIDLLTELIYQNTEFYKGCNEELELIPKSIAEEFFEWKFKKMKKQMIE